MSRFSFAAETSSSSEEVKEVALVRFFMKFIHLTNCDFDL